MELYQILVGLCVLVAVLFPSQLFWFTDQQLVLDNDLVLKYSKIQLKDIGYNGTWEQFCDMHLIEMEFAYYPQHELKLLRFLICQRREFNEILDCQKLEPFAAYKYCESVRPQADDFLKQLLSRFSQDDEEKRNELVDLGPIEDDTFCFTSSMEHFNDRCVDKKNPYFRMYFLMLARACKARWLTPDSIWSDITDVCWGRRLEGNINWTVITKTINCQD